MKTKKLTFSALFLAIALILPQVFHLSGVPKSGAVFLPMHIPVFLGGMLLGPIYGLFLGAVSPLLSMVLTGMPSAERVVFMVCELATYGLVSGLLFRYFDLSHKKYGSTLALIVAMIAGRLVYGCVLVLATIIFKIPFGGFSAVMVAISTGLPGIIIQLLFIPGVVNVIERGGYFNEPYRIPNKS